MTDGQVLPAGEEGICEAIPGSMLGLWDAAVKTEDNRTFRVAVVNITHDNLILEAGDVVGHMTDPRASDEKLEPLNDGVLAGIFGNICQELEEPKVVQINPVAMEYSDRCRGSGHHQPQQSRRGYHSPGQKYKEDSTPSYLEQKGKDQAKRIHKSGHGNKQNTIG
jgi:hypothetical protein